jgi:hypothetical protein
VYYIFNSLKSEDQSRKKPKDPPPVIEGIAYNEKKMISRIH